MVVTSGTSTDRHHVRKSRSKERLLRFRTDIVVCMIGLKRGIVQLASSHKQWTKEYKKEKSRIQKALGDHIVDIQHIGSTAVLELKAKPIIDILIGIKRLKDAKKLIKPMSRIGYKFHKQFGHQMFFAKGSDAS